MHCTFNRICLYIHRTAHLPLTSYYFWGRRHEAVAYEILKNLTGTTPKRKMLLELIEISKIRFEAFYGPLIVTIVLITKKCVDRSFSELWKRSKLCKTVHGMF